MDTRLIPALLIPAIPSTLLVGSIMLTNNIRDIRNDESHGRRNITNRFGSERALSLMSITYLFNFIWILAWIIVVHMTWFSLLAFFAAPLAFKTVHTLITKQTNSFWTKPWAQL